jgi:4-hydroxy-tetrahydrodipicolinate synthase
MFQGTGTALITPFDEQLNVDYASLKKLTRFQVDSKVEMLVVLGTTGESPVISDEERRKIIETVMEEAQGKAKIIVGTGTNDTRKTAKLNKMAEDLKVDGVLVVNPYYNKSTQAGLVEHYKYLSERCPLPFLLYNVASRTAMNLLPDTILKIHAECANVVAVKEASADISQIARLCAMKPESLTVISGNDDQTLPIMALGGKGVISVFSNVYPKEMKAITDAMLQKNYDYALQLHNKYLKMMNLLFVETNPMPIKYVASLLKLCKNILRLPLVPVTQQSEKLLAEEFHLLEV